MTTYEQATTVSGSESQGVVAQAQEKVQETAQQAGSAAAEAVRTQVEQRSAQISSEMTSIATAMRRSGHSLRADGNESSAKVVDAVAERLESLSGYLGRTDGNQMVHDVESFGRRQPWPLIGLGVTAGFLASRFLKASSRNRYQSSVGRPVGGFPMVPPPAAIPPVATGPASTVDPAARW